MKHSKLSAIIGVCSFLAVHAHAQSALLEDFSSLRSNTSGDALWSPYQGYCTQSGGIQNGMYVMTVGNCLQAYYLQFFPYPYVYPQGFMQNWLRSGSWNANADRFTFDLKCDAPSGGLVLAERGDGGNQFDMGTYVKPHSDTNQSNQGQHYYHSVDFNVRSGNWIHFTMNRHPNHIVGGDTSVDVGDDPEYNRPTEGAPVHYYDGLTRFYFTLYWGTSGSAPAAGTTCSVRNVRVSQTAYPEPDQLVYSAAAQYSGPMSGYPHGRYEVRWNSPPNTNTTFNVRYSTQSMHVNGFSSGTDGGQVHNTGNTYQGVYWNSPDMAQQSGLYVAIQPSGQSNFTELFIPGNSGPPVSVNACDINQDGVVNSTDVTLAQNAALGTAACTADLNGDGVCNVVDVQRVINAAVGSTCRVGP